MARGPGPGPGRGRAFRLPDAELLCAGDERPVSNPGASTLDRKPDRGSENAGAAARPVGTDPETPRVRAGRIEAARARALFEIRRPSPGVRGLERPGRPAVFARAQNLV